MERSQQIVITASGLSQAVPLDRYTNGYGITVISSGSIYTLQYSNSDPNFDVLNPVDYMGRPARYSNSYNVSGKWLNCDDASMVNASANRSTNFAFPPRGIRLNVSANVSAGNPVILQMVPMGMDGN